ncbi:MAG TPA: heavy metal-binding domain-containing protein [Pseudolabrys sp.]
MGDISNSGSIYICPMHPSVRQSAPGKCPKCGMALVPESARFALLRHMTSNPMHLIVMALVMLAVMSAVMMIKM